MTGMTGGSTLSRGAAAAAAGTTHAGGGGTHEGAYSDIEVTDAAHGAMAHESNPLNLLAFASALKATGYAPLGAMLEAQAALYEA